MYRPHTRQMICRGSDYGKFSYCCTSPQIANRISAPRLQVAAYLPRGPAPSSGIELRHRYRRVVPRVGRRGSRLAQPAVQAKGKVRVIMKTRMVTEPLTGSSVVCFIGYDILGCVPRTKGSTVCEAYELIYMDAYDGTAFPCEHNIATCNYRVLRNIWTAVTCERSLYGG